MGSTEVNTIFNDLIKFLSKFGFRILIAIVVFFILNYLKKYLFNLISVLIDKKQFERGAANFFKSFIKTVLNILLVLIIFSIVGLDASSITALFGALSIALGFAFKETLGNFAGGLLILIFRPFKTDDLIEAHDYMGYVHDISIFYTILRDFQNQEIIIPNGLLANNEIKNYSKTYTRRLDLKIGVDYNSDIKLVKEILEKIVKSNSKILSKPDHSIRLGELGASALNFDVFVWVKNEDYLTTKYDMYEAIKQEFDEHNIEIPFEQIDLNIKKGDL